MNEVSFKNAQWDLAPFKGPVAALSSLELGSSTGQGRSLSLACARGHEVESSTPWLPPDLVPRLPSPESSFPLGPSHMRLECSVF